MNKDIKEDWVEALRSGEHVQGTDKLEDGEGRQCCLGVLCEILDLPFSDTVDWNCRVYLSLSNMYSDPALLPQATRVKVGISRAKQDEIAYLNDNGASFDEIADYIEAEL